MMLLFAFIGCADPAGDTAVYATESGDCNWPSGATTEAVVLTDDASYEAPLTPDWGVVIDNESDYQLFKGRLGQLLEPVDFSSHVVLAAWAYSDCTCGIELRGWEAFNVDGRAQLSATFSDPTGGCDDCCDADGGALIAVSVPKGNGPASVCRVVENGCP
jgi:hypothetical protein